MEKPTPWHRPQSLTDELRQLRDIAAREHGPRARSTRLIEEALDKELSGRAEHRTASAGNDSDRTNR